MSSPGKVQGLADLASEFEPRQPRRERPASVERVEQWPSREPREQRGPDGALSIKGPERIIARFKAMCDGGRRVKYYDMLDAMMNYCERTGFNYQVESMTDEERANLLKLLGK